MLFLNFMIVGLVNKTVPIITESKPTVRERKSARGEKEKDGERVG